VQLEGIHHITCITADGQRNLDFYVGVMGLRLVKKTVNQDQPDVYHLFYADDQGSPGADLTFFEFRGIPEGRAGDGMVHRIISRVGSPEALDFWSARLADAGRDPERLDGAVRFRDPEGLEHELVVTGVADPPLTASREGIPPEHALQGFDGARAYHADPQRSSDLLAAISFEGGPSEWEARGELRGSTYAYDEPPAERGLQGAGTVHHVAWSAGMEEIDDWRVLAASSGASPTPVIDRFWFRSVYFREPSGVLFEIATRGPGFDVDEPAESLGESLVLPPFLEHRRAEIEATLTPLTPP
jgi:glyoxalase family protein